MLIALMSREAALSFTGFLSMHVATIMAHLSNKIQICSYKQESTEDTLQRKRQ